LRSGKTSICGSDYRNFGKRLVFYVGALIAISLLKVEKTVDVRQFESDLAEAVERYVVASLPIIVVLMFKNRIDEKDGVKSGDEKLLQEIIPIMQRSRLRDPDDIDELLQKLKLGGYSIDDLVTAAGEGRKELVWEKTLEKQYDTFELIDEGTVCVIERLPILKNDEVAERGLVLRKKTAK
jgi:hypothetical protein